MTEERTIGTIATAVIAVIALVLSAGALITSVARGSGGGGGGGGTTGGTEAPAAPQTLDVGLAEWDISPGNIQIGAGGKLEVTNRGAIAHDLEVVGAGIATPMLNAGRSATLDLAALAPGEYMLRCTIAGHEQAGMSTSLTVLEAGATPTGTSVSTGSGGGHGSHSDLTPEEWAAMDLAMHESIIPFPAETEGVGNVPLEPEILPNGTKRFELTAEIIEWEIAPGEWVEGWSYNGMIPGPMIKVDVGDTVQVVVNNQLPLGTDVHFHGIILPIQMDGVAPLTQDLIKPGETFTYEFTMTEPHVAMYHPHHHSQFKIPNGMWGVLIAGDVQLPEPGSVIGGRTLPDDLTIHHELPMVVNDAGTIGMSINGKSFPATAPIVANEGENILVHWYNEGIQIHPMHLHGLPQLVVAKDGFPLDQPYWVDTINVAPGERYSVLIPADVPGAWVLHCHILPHVETDEGMYGMVTAVIVQ